ncbi:MAG: saccharopine dehydrogenase NADP-binding domain-containing protein, partial [Thermoplasmata archaeon]|nr:saccharopine dehydrogenase NADP-binding domain-containing protein [Thermoplasmata archaeon]
MGRVVALDLARIDNVESVLLADADEEMAREADAFIGSSKVTIAHLDVTDQDAVVEAMRGYDVAISCVPYRYNFELTKAAIEAGCHLCDLGGNNDIVRKQLCLDAKARKA